jgi:hypothetical protein
MSGVGVPIPTSSRRAGALHWRTPRSTGTLVCRRDWPLYVRERRADAAAGAAGAAAGSQPLCRYARTGARCMVDSMPA